MHELRRWPTVKSVFRLAVTVGVLAAALILPISLHGIDKKKKAEPAKPAETSILERLDYSKIVWPNPPAITRIKYLDYFAGEKTDLAPAPATKKSAWMDRLAGVSAERNKKAPAQKYKLWSPYGIAVDSSGKVYVADPRVGAIFIFDPETKHVDMIKNGVHAKFGLVIGLAMDDGDRLFASDAQLHHVLIFNKEHRVEASISEGMVDPAGIAIDRENRFLYVADIALDQILVYDADTYKLLRKLGTTGKNHELTDPGNFSKPTNVAVDNDGNLYVSDTMNNRVQMFDADGTFLGAFGKAGDGPGTFARPKGIAVDADGHIWVADSVQNRVQVFNREGRLLIWLGSAGLLPGQFSAVTGIAIDSNNRVFTSEQYVGRVQMFRYITNDEAKAEQARRLAAEQSEGTNRAPTQQGTTSTTEQKPAPRQ